MRRQTVAGMTVRHHERFWASGPPSPPHRPHPPRHLRPRPRARPLGGDRGRWRGRHLRRYRSGSVPASIALPPYDLTFAEDPGRRARRTSRARGARHTARPRRCSTPAGQDRRGRRACSWVRGPAAFAGTTPSRTVACLAVDGAGLGVLDPPIPSHDRLDALAWPCPWSVMDSSTRRLTASMVRDGRVDVLPWPRPWHALWASTPRDGCMDTAGSLHRSHMGAGMPWGACIDPRARVHRSHGVGPPIPALDAPEPRDLGIDTRRRCPRAVRRARSTRLLDVSPPRPQWKRGVWQAGSRSLSCSPAKTQRRPSRRNGSNEVGQAAD